MKKKMRGVGLLVLMLSCGVVSLAEETSPISTDPICFGTGLINGGQEIEITGYNTSNSDCGKNVVIPAEIDGKPVTSIGDYALSNKQLTGVVIPGSVKSIGGSAFYRNQLTSVVIPGSVTSIGTGAFSTNQLLTSVVISDGVESIGDYAFYDNQLTSVVIPGSVKSIGDYVFYYNQLISVVIPGSVKSIGDYAFYDNQLTSVVIPGSVKSIGNYVFAENKLTSVVIPDSVTSIGTGAFYKGSVTDGYTGVVVGIVTKEPTTITVAEDAHIKLVKFDLAGGIGAVNVTCKGTGCSVTSVPTRAGYIFSGWSEGLKVWDEGSSNWNTGHQTIIAQWNSDPSSSSSSSSSS